MEETTDINEIKKDIQFMPRVLRHIFGSIPMPIEVKIKLEGIYTKCEKDNLEKDDFYFTSLEIMQSLIELSCLT